MSPKPDAAGPEVAVAARLVPSAADRRLLQHSIALLLLLKLAILLAAPPLGDSAYYWRWGQSLDWSYLDHPPLNAWALRLSYETFGWNLFALRVPTLVSAAITAWVLLQWAPRSAETGRRDWQIPFGVALASPLIFIFTSISFPDHWLIAFSALAVHFFARFARSAEVGQPRFDRLYAAAVAIGVAALAKYSAIFVGLGFVAWFPLRPAGRALVGSPHVWTAGMLALVLQAPVAFWNIEHGFGSLQLHFHDRLFGSTDAQAVAGRVAVFAVLAMLMISPPFVAAGYRLVIDRVRQAPSAFRVVGGAAFGIALAVFAALATRTQVYFYWIVPAVAAILPVAAFAFTARGFRFHLIYGVLGASLLTVNMCIVPVAAVFGLRSAEEISFGWKEIATRVNEEAARHDARLLLATQYNLAALLGFEMGRTDVYSVTPRPEQYDFWFQQADYAGADAILLADADRPVYSDARRLFASLEPIGSVEIRRFGILIHTYQLYLGRDLRPPPG